MEKKENSKGFVEITPSEGMYLYNGTVISNKIFIRKNCDFSKWNEITEEEKNEIEKKREEEIEQLRMEKLSDSSDDIAVNESVERKVAKQSL